MKAVLTEIISGGRTHQHTATIILERGLAQPTLRAGVNLVNLVCTEPGPTGEEGQ